MLPGVPLNPYSLNINITKQQSINIAVIFGLSVGPSDSRQGHRFAFYYVGRNVVGNEYMKVDLWPGNSMTATANYLLRNELR